MSATSNKNKTDEKGEEEEEEEAQNLDDFDPKKKLKQTDKYTFVYRIVKTCLLVFAWIVFGINNEIVGSTFEDLRILIRSSEASTSNNETINATMVNDYHRISFGLELRGVGYLIMMFAAGVIYDKLAAYADLIMGISSFVFAFPNYLIPWTSNYILICIWFLIQGIATATYDLGGNHIVLALWAGITSSPINAMHAGYGIGAIIAVQLSKPFIKFNPFDELSNSKLKSNDVSLQIPYSIGASIGMLLAALFVIAQVIETRNNKLFEKKMSNQLKPLASSENKDYELKKIKENDEEADEVKQSFFQKLCFGKRNYKGKALAYQLTQISLLVIAFFCIQGYITVISRYLLTYLTKGPGNFDIDTYTSLATLYWSIFIVARFLAAFVAYKMNTILFVFGLLTINMIVCLLFVIPFFTNYKLFFWLGVSLMGLTSGPMQPSSFMVAKTFLVDYNAFILSIFSVGMSFGNIFFQKTGGLLLDGISPADSFLGFDHFKPAYIIAHAFFLPSLLCFLIFIPIILIYKRYVYLVRK